MKAAQLDAKKAPPPFVVKLQPSAWSEAWAKRPTGVVSIGLRRLTADQLLSAHLQAVKITDKLLPMLEKEHDGEPWQIAYETVRLHMVLGFAMTDPEDVTRIPSIWKHQDGEVMVAPMPSGKGIASSFFTRDGLQRLYDGLEVLTLIDNPSWPLATDEQLAELAAGLEDGSFFDEAAPGDGPTDEDSIAARRKLLEQEVRRLLSYAMHLRNTGFTTPLVY